MNTTPTSDEPTPSTLVDLGEQYLRSRTTQSTAYHSAIQAFLRRVTASTSLPPAPRVTSCTTFVTVQGQPAKTINVRETGRDIQVGRRTPRTTAQATCRGHTVLVRVPRSSSVEHKVPLQRRRRPGVARRTTWATIRRLLYRDVDIWRTWHHGHLGRHSSPLAARRST
ncbi:hypothetical protein BD626DRAFT_494249 [Schizophyllum amplum]|uniref:Uncharacterized protein n=1 Tax=Schizophyllum amplum TaxID=97359 RepID=A0A550CF20_9AGAR|nr:hypothetical protein BD626DRAFT_494249 [Auriculariopsis ampla]